MKTLVEILDTNNKVIKFNKDNNFIKEVIKKEFNLNDQDYILYQNKNTNNKITNKINIIKINGLHSGSKTDQIHIKENEWRKTDFDNRVIEINGIEHELLSITFQKKELNKNKIAYNLFGALENCVVKENSIEDKIIKISEVLDILEDDDKQLYKYLKEELNDYCIENDLCPSCLKHLNYQDKCVCGQRV